jgi:hypothetical protein
MISQNLNWKTRGLTILSATLLATLIACGGGGGGTTSALENASDLMSQITSAATATTSVFNCL